MKQSNNEQPQGSKVLPGELHVFNLEGFIQTRATVPTDKPKSFSSQLVLVTNGGSTRTYIYDTVGLAWRYTQMT